MNQAHSLDQSRSLPFKRSGRLVMVSGLILGCASASAAPVDAAIVRGSVDIKNTQAKKVVEQFMNGLAGKTREGGGPCKFSQP